MLKKILLFLTLPLFLGATLVTVPVGAASGNVDSNGESCEKRSFAGLVPWDCNVTNTTSQDNLKQNIWVIAANILSDISIVAAYLVLGYVIYGGYLYTFSSGDPNKIAIAKKTLSQAFIGLAIVMLATVILNTFRIALGVNFSENCAANSCTDPANMISSFIQWVIAVAGVTSIIFVVYGGISYISSAGDPPKLQKAKTMITYALIGLVIVALSEIITAFVTNMINDAKEAGFTNQTIISKEVHEKNTY